MGMAFLMLLCLGVCQLALTLYARNTVIANAHEAARSAIELGRDPSEVEAIAREAVDRAAGRVVDELGVVINTTADSEEVAVSVTLTGVLHAFGPLPMNLPVEVTARSSRAVVP